MNGSQRMLCDTLYTMQIIANFQILTSAHTFFCLACQTFILTAMRTAAAEHTELIFSSRSLSSLTVLSNTERSLFNNQIELLNKEFKFINIIMIALILLVITHCHSHVMFTVCKMSVTSFLIILLNIYLWKTFHHLKYKYVYFTIHFQMISNFLN